MCTNVYVNVHYKFFTLLYTICCLGCWPHGLAVFTRLLERKELLEDF